MNNIKVIINEEINKFIITENIQTLMQLGNQLNNMLKQVCKMPTNNLNQNADKLIYNTEYFVIQIIQAINRCVQKNNLNEGFFSGLNFTSGWGLNIPPELGGNFWNDAKRGYYNTKNLLNGNKHNSKNITKTQYGKINTTTVKSEKLSSLLQRSTQMYQNYLAEEARYQIPQNAPQISQGMRNIFAKIGEINQQYNQLLQNQNAQGTNP